jgi:hypothetical protein
LEMIVCHDIIFSKNIYSVLIFRHLS